MKLSSVTATEAWPVNSAPESAGNSPESVSAPSASPSGAAQQLIITNPAMHIDSRSGLVIVEYRDAATGAVEAQYPSKKVVEAYRAASRDGDAPPKQGAPAVPTESAEAGQGDTQAAKPDAPAPEPEDKSS